MVAKMATFPTVSSPDEKVPVLNSWKEIATYLGRGVRTVQRYERELHLPVRRFNGKPHASVVALPGDLDAWLREVALSDPFLSPKSRSAAAANAVRSSVAESRHLRSHCRDLRMTSLRELEILVANLAAMIQQMNLGAVRAKKITH
jgi:hypothetical protein